MSIESKQTLVASRSADSWVNVARLWQEDLGREPIHNRLECVLPAIGDEPMRVNGRLVKKPWKGTGVVAVTDVDRNLVACRHLGRHEDYDQFGKSMSELEFPAIKKAIVRGQLKEQQFPGGIAKNYLWLHARGYQFHAGDTVMTVDNEEYYIGVTLAMATAEHILAMFCLPAAPIFIKLLSRMPDFEWTQAGLMDTRMAESVRNKLSGTNLPLSRLSFSDWQANS